MRDQQTLRHEPHCGLVRVRASAQGNSKGWAKRQLIERLLFDARWWCSSCTRGSAGAAPRISHSFEPVNESVKEPKYNGSSDNHSENRSSKENYSNEFEKAWQAYPKRAGGNSKAAAWKAWKARIKDGVNTEAMLAGVNRYAGYVRATGSAGTQYVKQAATFFGPDRHFEEPWQAPSGAVSGRPGGLPVSGFSEQDYGQSDCNW